MGNGEIMHPGMSYANRKIYDGMHVISVSMKKKAAISDAALKTIAAKNGDETGADEQAEGQPIAKKTDVNMSALIPVELPTGPYYFPAQQLTEKPKVVQDVMPALPLIATPMQPTVISLLINEYGDIDDVVIEDANVPVQTATLIKKALKRMKFYPGMLENMPVKTQLKIEVTLQSSVQLP
jgi:hypothetical protein